MKTIVARSAIIASALLLSLIVFSPKASIAEPLFSQFQQQKQESKQNSAGTLGKAESPDAIRARTPISTLSGTNEEQKALLPGTQYVATAYSLRGRTASGRMVSKGLIAADPSFLPLGSRVKLESAGYSGEYLVADTGGAIRGRRIDIWTPSTGEALRFGRRKVKLTVLSYGGKRPTKIAKL
ncbi:MAG: 3D domain-containing protein [Acidobacteriota bacterium]|nr:3D domain-containing protein [Acidobacteriota bacterium]